MNQAFFQKMLNPFIVVAGGKALVIGLVLMLQAAALGEYAGAIQSGLISFRIVPSLPVWAYFAIPLIGWGIGATLFYLVGRCFSQSKIRAIDVFGTLALARIPISLLVPILAIPFFRQIQWDQPRTNEILPITLFCVLLILLVVWTIVLTYNAFSVSCNLKGGKAVGLFIGVLLLSEMIFAPLSFLVLVAMPQKTVDPVALQTIVDVRTPEGADPELVAKSKAILEHIVKQEFDKVPPYFNVEMKAALSATDLRLAWLNETILYGNFVEANPTIRTDETQEYRRVLIYIKFLRKEQVFLTVYDKEGKVAGLFFQNL